MTKLILKTAAITLAAVIVFLGLVFGAFALFFPRPLARFFENAGNLSAAAVFYERQYEKSGEPGDLAVLCDVLDEHTSPEKAEKYLGEFVYSDEFESFCADYDETYGVYTYSARELYQGRYVVARFINSGASSGVESALAFTEEGGYTEYNSFYWLITDGGLIFSENDVSVVKAALDSLSLQDGERAFLERDIALCGELLQALGQNGAA